MEIRRKQQRWKEREVERKRERKEREVERKKGREQDEYRKKKRKCKRALARPCFPFLDTSTWTGERRVE